MNCTGKRCIMQYDKVDPATCQCVSYCPQATPPKTNADRIRAMTDEELAEKLAIHVGCNKCPGWSVICGEKCTEYWLKWLKQEIN